ncbi:MEKK [Heracleum sosnowskyi]|uniref:MEKK n=1 Tax=Heracleum sosnowskyi TaxID=360622 RepID=A0AAD8MGC1_9APIA|nr:MEKK [Heracleum sosnowskyi]
MDPSGGDSSSTSTDNVSPVGSYRRIASTWKKGRLLGQGSYGPVYEGITDDGFFFAVKEVSYPDQYVEGMQIIKQLEQAISLLSTFEHENIVQYYGTYKEDSSLYIFLELVSKGSLRNLYQQNQLIDAQASAYTREILLGLKYLHDRNVVHRDINCANILIDANGTLKLSKFGIAKARKLYDDCVEGRACWMAPEVVKSSDYGLAADIWSLGCTVLEMITGQSPYFQYEFMQALYKIGQSTPPNVPDSISKDARDFILQCLQGNPTSRPTASQLLEHPFVKERLPSSSELVSPQSPR